MTTTTTATGAAYALVDATHTVVDTVLWDGQTPVTFDPGTTAVLCPAGFGIGDTFDGTSWAKAAPAE